LKSKRKGHTSVCLPVKNGLSITYLSKMSRKATREVVKKRGEYPHVSFENEAVRYSIVEFFGSWALQLRPAYVFTRSDGETPLSPLAQTRRSTTTYEIRTVILPSITTLCFGRDILSQGQPALSLGNVGVNDLILDSEYLSAEVPKSGGEESCT